MKDRLLQTLTDAADFLLARTSSGEETSRSHSWPWPPSVTIVLLVLVTAVVLAAYWREVGTARRWQRAGLAALRLALVVLVLFMLYGWMLHRHRTELPDLVVLLDDSTSMTSLDHYDEPLRSRLRKRLQASGGGDGTRFELAKLLLLERDAVLLTQLRTHYNLKFYLVGATARVQSWEASGAEASVDRAWRAGVRRLEARETASRLGKGVRDVLEAQRGRPTAAIVMLTDGVTTEGKTIAEVAEYARRKTVPLYLVGLGNDRPPRDVRLSDLLVDEVVFVGDLVTFDFKVSGTGYAGQRVAVRLTESGRPTPVLAEDAVTLGADGESLSARLAYRPLKPGDYEYVVDAGPLAGEANRENNRQTRRVKVRDETLRVLYVQEYPSFEFRFLKNTLNRELKRDSQEKAIALTTVLQEADPEYAALDETAATVFPVNREELFAYDVLLLGDVNPSYLSRSVLDNIVAFVETRGGGLVVMAGPRHMPLAFRETPLARLLPIDINTATVPPPEAVLTTPITVTPTRLGLASPQMQWETPLAANLRAWRALPPIYWLLPAADLRPGARVLAEEAGHTGVGGAALPVVSMQFVGAGKVIFHATDETYRWARHPAGERYFATYWLQTLRYLSRPKLLAGSRAAELTADREEYRAGDPVRLRLRFFDDRLAPAADDGVTLVLEQEGRQRRQIKLHRDALSRGIFEGVLSDLPEGAYNAWVAAPTLPGQPPAQRFSVVAPPGEQARLEMDAADLQRAAQVAQGKYYTLQTADQLGKDLPRGRQVRIESLPPTPVWNSPLVAALFVLLITAEWLGRKRVGWL